MDMNGTRRSTPKSCRLIGIATLTLALAMTLVAPNARGAVMTTSNSPNPSSSINTLNGVVAISPNDAWAVGWYQHNKTGHRNTLTLHWNGSRWSRVWSPNGPKASASYLQAVSAVSSTDVWAVGHFYKPTTGAWRPLTLHWDGTRWLRVWSPNPGSIESFLYGVSAVSSTDVWAVGYFYSPIVVGGARTLTLHWNGSKWARVWSPSGTTSSDSDSLLWAVSAVSTDHVWAVGRVSTTTPGGETDTTLVLRWNGIRWSRNGTPNVGGLGGVSADTATDAWAVGGTSLRWNGIRWSQVPRACAANMFGASAVSPTDAWAVGQGCVQHWDGTNWSRVWT